MSRMGFGSDAGAASTPFRFLLYCAAVVLILLSPVSQALGASAISCHCFQDRSFDPAEPRRVEPYLLATTRNSFLAMAYGQSKKEIVRLRMAGSTAGEDLWVAYYLAQKVGIPASELLQAREKTDSWRSVPEALPQIDPARTGPLFGRVLAQGGSDVELARAAADDTLITRAGASPEELKELRERGADSGEIILALLLSRRIDRPAADLHAQVQAGQLTWGGLVDSVGIDPGEIENAVKGLFHREDSP